MPATFKSSHKVRGFTLLELLIAIVVFAVMSIMAYGGLSQIIRNNTSAEQSMARMQEIQQAMYAMTRDFNQIIQRDIRDELGTTQPYILSNSNLGYVIEFTRNGRRNPGGFLRSNLQRIAYEFSENKLYRLAWPQLDRVQGMEPNKRELLGLVDSFSIRYLDAKAGWHDQWPPLNAAPGAAIPLPAAIEVSLELKDWGKLKRLYNVSR